MLGNVKALYQRYAAASRTFFQRTQVKHWEKVAAAGPPSWDERNRIIAGFISAGSSVLDLGAGAQTLRSYIPQDCRYQPCDIVRTTPDTIVCDFNHSIFPPVDHPFDYIICSGVLEYMWKPRAFLERLPTLGKKLLLSYNPRTPGESKIDRLSKNWVSHLDQDELHSLFESLGWEWSIINIRPPTEYLYLLEWTLR
ncbi:MAG TPA: hypothetical protein VFE47_01860 [Tepidisphaeraceae bacterium]|jgi:hypothetical protein|nr:hypothetical protein [Tepidisphaeraceae bacterium]